MAASGNGIAHCAAARLNRVAKQTRGAFRLIGVGLDQGTGQRTPDHGGTKLPVLDLRQHIANRVFDPAVDEKIGTPQVLSQTCPRQMRGGR